MARLAELKHHAIELYARGEALAALRLNDAIVAAAPLDHEARLRAADCLAALGAAAEAVAVYRAVAWYALRSGHPLLVIVCARVLAALGGEADDLLAALVVTYGSESEQLGALAARISLPDPGTEIPAPDLRAPVAPGFAAAAAARATSCLDDFAEYPAQLHPVPLLSTLSEDGFRRVLGTFVVRRLPHGAHLIREGEPGESFFLLAVGELRVYATDGLGRETELARLGENAVFGEMALLTAQPRSASVQVLGVADVIEINRQSLAALADELSSVAAALHAFTRERLLRNLMAQSPLFRPFSRMQQRELLRRFTSHDVAPGTTIIRQGETGTGLFVVLSGEVEVERSDGAGVRQPLATLRTGDVFGEMALLRGGVTTASVTAARPSTVLFLAREYVERMVAGVPAVRDYLQALAENRELDARLLFADAAPEEEVILL
jgi:CRP-like cAMP-binding protein